MGSRAQPNKFLVDIEECVSELKQEFSNTKSPINDDCAILHTFQEKLELILLFGLIEKPGLLASKKSYWNYFTTCLSSSKRKHDGINFVKSIVSLKTPVGRGRAFIRFCLTQKCLADTLQACFMNQKVSRDFYTERSLPVQESLWSALVNSLYELNDINFDLSAGYTELDISWPKFARKVFVSSENIGFPRKNMSSSSLQSFSSQDEHNIITISNSNSSSGLETLASNDLAQENVSASGMAEENEELNLQNKSLQNRIKQLEGEKNVLEANFQDLLKKYQSLKDHQCSSMNEKSNELSNIDIESKVCNLFSNTSDSVYEDVKALVSELVEEKVLNENQPSLSLNSTVKNNIKQDGVNDSSDCALNIFHEQSSQTSSPLNSDIDILHSSTNCLSQNQIYMTELLQEIKTVIDDIEDIIQKSNVSLALPYITRLKRIRNSLEEKVSSDMDKSRNHLNFSHFVENCVSSMKNFITKQENVIESLQENSTDSFNKNQILYSRIGVLKDLLRSYGFLKLINEKESLPKNIPLSDSSSFSTEACEEFSYDNLAHDPLLKRIIIPILPVINSSSAKLNSVTDKVKDLNIGLDLSVDLVNLLISRLRDQEVHLKGVTKELEEAQNLVSVLKEQHTKLQSAEGILKYDLQEKRKLLSRLKQQLESTRKDFNQVRIKNSKSEAEWQDLRNEFVQRHKQTSEESGFLEDKGFEDYENTPSNSSCTSNHSKENTPEKIMLSESPEIPDHNSPPKKSRLELLEEQCQSLYSSLLQSSKRRIEIDRRLDSVCKSVDKTVNRTKHKNISSNLPAESANEVSFESPNMDVCDESIELPTNNCANSLQSSSDIGSLNSESSYIPVDGMDNSSAENFEEKSCISSSSQNLETVGVHSLMNSERIDDNDEELLPDVDCSLGCISDGDVATLLPCEDMELTENDDQVLISHVDSLLIKKKDLEESLRTLAAESDLISSNKAKYLEAEEYLKQISVLEEERMDLLQKTQELESKAVVATNELDHAKQQLILSEATKEHEVAALQFQLNTEVLKYEQALKEFHEQSKGLESMKQRVTEQEELIVALEEALTEIRMDRESANEQQWQESLCDFEEERNRNEILMSQLEELKMYNERDKLSMKTELAFLQNYSRELQKKLVKLLKEKDILWKRSNHLYHLHREKIDDRWIKDSEVSSCLGCKNTFSFMLRKHHCRLCGRIFCYACSNNWLLTASSSKKIRTCNECFMQYMDTKKAVRRGSDVPQVDEDSGDEGLTAQLPFIPKSCSSFTSEIPSSINDSILSLPITQKQSSPRFASAPDLQYLFKTMDEALLCSNLSKNPLVEGEQVSLADDNTKKSEILDNELNQNACVSVSQDNSTRNSMPEEIFINIKEPGQSFKGEFAICPEGIFKLVIFCETCPVNLQWCFIANAPDVSLRLLHKSEKHPSGASNFFDKEPKMQDEMQLADPGHYVFCFENKDGCTEIKIQYSLSLKDAIG